MTDGGHLPSDGSLVPPGGHVTGASDHLVGADPLTAPIETVAPGLPLQPAGPLVGEPWTGEQRPAYTFLDQPDPLDEDEDELLMPGPQTAWGDALHGAVETVVVDAGAEPYAAEPFAVEPFAVEQAVFQQPAGESPEAQPAERQAVDTMALRAVEEPAPAAGPGLDAVAEQPPGVPVEPSWPPLAPPLQENAPVQNFAPEGVPQQPAPSGVPVEPTVQFQVQPPALQAARRPLHAGPPVPDPSLMTGQVPVRSLADRGPSGTSGQGATPAHGVPAVPMPVPAQPVAEQPLPVEPVIAEPLIAEPLIAEPVIAEPVITEQVVVEPVAAGPAVVEPVAVEPVAVEPLVVEPVAVAAAVADPTTVAEPVEVQPVAVVADLAVQAVVGTEAAPQAAGVATATAPAPEAPVAGQPVEVQPAAVAPVAPEPVQAQPAVIPAQPGGQSRRIAAFLADPAPQHGLPTIEPVAVEPVQPEPVQPEPAQPEPVLAEPVLAEQAPVTEVPAAEPVTGEPTPAVVEVSEPEPVVVPVAEPVAQPEAVLVVEAPEEDRAAELPVADVPVAGAPAADAPVDEVPVADAPVDEAPVVPEQADDRPAEAPVAVEAETGADSDPDFEPEPETAERTAPAPGYDEAGREAVHQVIRERRDIRNGFRPDPIPHEVLLRVLEAAHTAPSVGYSQPWDFVVIRSRKTRKRMHALAERQRDVYADSLPKGRAKQFKEIKIEAILETPVNIVVTADRTRGGRHTLGRHTQPQMAPYSAALAVENLWLAARAEGLGVGWVSFFDEDEMVRELGLPEHLDVVAYLCVGYVDAFPDEPELQQQGWAKKRPLSWVVHEEQYGNRALPGEEPHSLLADTLRGIRPLDAKSLGDAWDRQKRMTKPAGSLGVLEIIAAQLCGLARKCPPPIPEPGCVAIFAGDHGVHAQGVTPWPQEVTGQMVANFLAGGAVVNAFAAQVGAEVCVVDVGVKSDLPDPVQQGRTTGLLPRKVKAGTDDMTQGPAMSREEAVQAIEVGIETARDLVAAGNKVLITGDMGIANTTASAALISVFTGIDPAEVTGRGTGIDDTTHARKVEVVRAALALHQPDPADPIGVLAAVGGLEHAAIAGFLLGAASLRTPVILDGVIAGSAALAAKAIAPEAAAACIAGHRSAEPGHQAALSKLGLRPLIDLDLRLGEGTGALLALPLVQSAARAMHDVATFDSAGVTEKA